MTEFGRLHFDAWFRIRAVLLAFAFLLTLAVSQFTSIPLLVFFLIVIAGDAVLSAFGTTISKRFTPHRTVCGLLLLDLLLTFFAVFFSGGLEGGFAAIYLIIVLSALLMLGQRAAVRFALIASVALRHNAF